MRLVMTAVAVLSLAACSKGGGATTANAPTDTGTPPVASASSAPDAALQADATAGGNAAVKAPHPEDAGPPAAGANSFTEAEAKGHIENSGYTGVSELTKDENGLWHGRALKGGQQHQVSLDYKGNVVAN